MSSLDKFKEEKNKVFGQCSDTLKKAGAILLNQEFELMEIDNKGFHYSEKLVVREVFYPVLQETDELFDATVLQLSCNKGWQIRPPANSREKTIHCLSGTYTYKGRTYGNFTFPLVISAGETDELVFTQNANLMVVIKPKIK
jgi:hypothetical protein